MSVLTTCKKGDQTACTTADSCCYYMKVTEVDASPTAAETAARTSYKALGLPVEKDKEAYICMGKTTWDAYKDAKDQTAEFVGVGVTYNMYCAGASALKAAGVLLSAAVMASI